MSAPWSAAFGPPVPIDRRSTASALGFDGIYANSLDAVSDRDFTVEFSAAASLVMVHLSRLAEEVIFWASEECGFVQLTDRCATGSSLMPQKKNPDVPELVRGKCGRVFGHLQGLLTMIKGLPLAYNKDFQEDKEALFDVVATTSQCLEAMTILMQEGLSFRTERLEAAVAVTTQCDGRTDHLPSRFFFGRLINWLCLGNIPWTMLLRELTWERGSSSIQPSKRFVSGINASQCCGARTSGWALVVIGFVASIWSCRLAWRSGCLSGDHSAEIGLV